MCEFEIKSEFNHYENRYCDACLSSNRKLNPLGGLNMIYHKICDNEVTALTRETLMCWECTAVLKKVMNFKSKVHKAHEIMCQYYLNKQLPPSTSLSNLTLRTTDTEVNIVYKENDSNEHTDTIQGINELKNMITDFKQEMDSDDSFANNIEYVYQDDDIKEELISKVENCVKISKNEQKVKNSERKFTKFQKLPQNKKYRIITDIKDKSLRQKIKINSKEIQGWQQKEIDNTIYKSLSFKCDKCLCAWEDKERLLAHNINCHDETAGDYSCHICTTRFSTKSQLESHIRKHYYIQQCVVCDYKCYTSNIMIRHMEIHRGLIHCLDCKGILRDLPSYRRHNKAIHSVCYCDYCGWRCRTKRTLEKHIKRHHAPVYLCKICNKQMKTYKTLRAHNKLKHVVLCDENSYCVQCNKQFDNVTLFKRHLQSSVAHSAERQGRTRSQVPCPDCGKLYSRKVYMTNHYNFVHAKRSKYHCDDCDKYFLTRTRYKEHRQYQHDGMEKVRNKVCNICGRGFTTNKILTHHIRTHTGERPHECVFCNAKFAQMTALQNHVKHIHMGHKRSTK